MTSADEDGFFGYDIALRRRGLGRRKWVVVAAGGEVVASGSECSRAAARYKAERALFSLLCATASQTHSGDQTAGRRRSP